MEDRFKLRSYINIQTLCWIIFLLSIAAVLMARLRLLNIPLERDEGEYAYLGQLLLQGIPPYKLAYNMKLPGTYAAYVLIMSLFGQTTTGIHLGLLIANIISAVLMFFITKRLFGLIAGIFSSASYAVLSVSQSVLGLHAHATHFVVLSALLGLMALLMATGTHRPGSIFLSGLFFGMAFLMKQQGIFFILFGLFYLLWDRAGKKDRLKTGLIPASAAYITGAIAPFAVTCLLMLLSGNFEKFWFWTFKYASAYLANRPFHIAIKVFFEKIWQIAGPCWPIWLTAMLGCGCFLIDTKARRHAVFIAMLSLASLAAVCSGSAYREHYYIVLLPAVSLLAGLCVSSLYGLMREREELRLFSFVPIVLFAGSLAWPIVQQKNYLFEMSPEQVSRQTYGANPFIESINIADHIKAGSSPGDTVAVLGSEPQIYFYSQRHSATGYIYVYPLMEDQPYALRMQAEMIREIESKNPRYIVYVSVSTSWLRRPDSADLILKWADEYIYRWYDLDGVVNIFDNGTEYYWGDAAKGVKSRSPCHLLVYKRKQS